MYQWRWKPGGDEQTESQEWQLCDMECSDGSTLKIPSVQKLNEGRYHCVISNCAGSQKSEAAILSVGKNPILYASMQAQINTVTFLSVAEPPRITNHPQDFKDVVPGTPVNFTITTARTEPLSYQWQWKPPGEEGGSEEWQVCDMEGPQTALLSIPSVQKSNEGSYRCVVSNCAVKQISEAAKLSIGKNLDINHKCMKHLVMAFCFIYSCTADPPRVTTDPKRVKDAVSGQPVTFTAHAAGTEPLSYQWQWKPAGEEGGSEEWQLCDVEGSQTAMLSIPSVQKPNEGQYCCNISNCAGSQTSNTATLSLGKKPIDVHYF